MIDTNVVLAKLDSLKEVVDEVKEQVLKTNGRVSALENWRWFITGGLAIISLIVIPTFIYMIKNILM